MPKLVLLSNLRSTRYGHLGRVPLPHSYPGASRAQDRDSRWHHFHIPSHLRLPRPLERPEEEILKGPEVGRRMEKFQRGVAIHCHLDSPQPEPAVLLVAFSNVCSTALCEVPSVSSTQGTRGSRGAELQAGLRAFEHTRPGRGGGGLPSPPFIADTQTWWW